MALKDPEKRKVAEAWSRLTRWLETNAPRTHATLLPPVAADVVRDVVAKVGRTAPESLVALYGLAGGQRDTDHTRGGPQGIFGGYWFMPIDGVDGLAQALEDWKTAMDGGADWATPNRFPFAKDFGGAYLCIEVQERDAEDEDDAEEEISIVEAGDCEPDDDPYDSLSFFVAMTVDRLVDTAVTIDERLEERELHEVLFDACRPRTVGDVLKHSVFEKLAIRATVEDTSEARSSYQREKHPGEVFGLAVRLVSDGEIEVDDIGLVDPYDTPIPANTGKSSGGGKPGTCVYVWDKRPLPDRSRLRVTIARIRRM